MLGSLCIRVLDQGLCIKCVYWLNKNGFAVDDISENAEQETSVMRSRKEIQEKTELNILYSLGMNYFCWMWLFSALCQNVEIFDVECPTKRDTTATQLSHVERYFGRQRVLLFDVRHVILDPFQISAEVNRMLAMLPGSLDFVMLLMHSNVLYFFVCLFVCMFQRVGPTKTKRTKMGKRT